MRASALHSFRRIRLALWRRGRAEEGATSRHSPPLIRSAEAGGAGRACVAMLAAWHGVGTPARGVANDEPGLAEMTRLLQDSGLPYRPCRILASELSSTAAPCILAWDGPAYVVLASAGPAGLVLNDPERGRVSASPAEALSRSGGVAFKGDPGPAQTRLAGRSGLGLRLGALREVLFLALALELLWLALPAGVAFFLDDLLATGAYGLLPLLAAGVLVVGLLHAGVRLLYALAWPPLLVMHQLRLHARWLRGLGMTTPGLPPSTAEEASLVRSQRVGLLALAEGGAALCSFGLLLAIAWQMAMVTMAVLVLYYLLARENARRCLPLAETLAQSTRQHNALRAELCLRTPLLQRFGRAFARRRQVQGAAVKRGAALLSLSVQRAAGRALQALLFAWQAAQLLMMGTTWIESGRLQPGVMLAALLLVWHVTRRGARLIDWLCQVNALPDSALAPAPVRREAITASSEAAGAVLVARGLQFRHADAPAWLLKDLSFTLERGQPTLLCGPSGAGKTTLLRILLGEFPLAAGVLVTTPECTGDSGRLCVAAVLQGDGLLAGTLRDNIALFAELPDQSAVEACARIAGAHADILALPRGYDTRVDADGLPLPHGLRARVMLARALYTRPALLLLDEATALLPEEAERTLLVELAAHDIACLVVSRRLEAGGLPIPAIRLA